MNTTFHTRASLAADLRAIGIDAGDSVMVHAAVGRCGPLLGGPDALIGALSDAVAASGTILVYTDWDAAYEDLLDDSGRVPEAWREHVPPFDSERSRAIRDNGVLPEFLRTTPGARRSGNPGASVAALGARAEAFTDDHPIDYGYGENSPLARLVGVGGKVLMIGAPWETMTLLHHAEHLAHIPGKRMKRTEVPFATAAGVRWRFVEEFDTGSPIVDGLAEEYFEDVVRAFVATGQGRQGAVGDAPSLLVDARAICAFAIDWLERTCGRGWRHGAGTTGIDNQ
ncbi:aminoglycoside 3-N-acetyltransferase [Sphingosinicella sp. BN140058]|uniref:aminoglycoside 3-N-acetyltransferase n=1 Tax=Sphingosinicella sp. BN140058 TaxID=1892855 RepID=UPI0010109048|nr:aminoglycoside 3-N-acetyltransferase [Sphingosinicella sp. BN140058]QAY75347.1 aminoglycoside 3-N-acetyltransferase [Sphingosinicella sp. BN140058]